MNDDFPVVHLWSPEYFHDDSYVVGNYEGLMKLRNAIDKAIKEGNGKEEVFISDGEGYDLNVIRSDNIDHIAVPYLDEIAAENRENAVYPWDVSE
jgi:hypothetical protein